MLWILALSARKELVSGSLDIGWLMGFIVPVGVLVLNEREEDFEDRLAVAEPDEELELEDRFLALNPSEEPKAGYAKAAEATELAVAGRVSPGFNFGIGGGGSGSANFASNPPILNADFEELVFLELERFWLGTDKCPRS